MKAKKDARTGRGRGRRSQATAKKIQKIPRDQPPEDRPPKPKNAVDQAPAPLVLPPMGYFSIHGTDFMGELRPWACLTHEAKSALLSLILVLTTEPGAVLAEDEAPAITGLTPSQWAAAARLLSPTFITVEAGLVSVVRMARAYPDVVRNSIVRREKAEDAAEQRWRKYREKHKGPDAPSIAPSNAPLERKDGRTETTEGVRTVPKTGAGSAGSTTATAYPSRSGGPLPLLDQIHASDDSEDFQ